jgi:putative dimethyl sulfoxide reductase chaperone
MSEAAVGAPTSSSARHLDEGLAQAVGLLAAIYLLRPTKDAIEAWRALLSRRSPALLEELARIVAAIDVTDEAGLEALAWEHTRLFIGPYRLPAPPWESVYTSPKRILMGETYDGVVDFYQGAGVALGDPNVLADHVSAELNFAAVLLGRASTGVAASGPLETVQRFVDQHLANWIPRFTADLESAAEADLYRALARATRSAVQALGC